MTSTALYERIKADMMATLKGAAEDRTTRLIVLRGIKSVVDLDAKEHGHGLQTDDLVEKVLVRELKKRADAEASYAMAQNVESASPEIKAAAAESAAREQQEAQIIKEYLPTPMTREEVDAKLTEVITRLGPSIGPVMKEMRAFTGARFPGKELADLVKIRGL